MRRQLSYVLPSPVQSCCIDMWRGSLREAVTIVQALAVDKRFAVITDDSVFPIYGQRIFQALSQAGLNGICLSIPSGEHSKTRAMKEKLENSLFEHGFGKDSCLIAVGGGVITDLTGFIAATYCRGIELIMVPTSLLAMVDASIGGKNGVDVPWGKNLIGSIYQPKKILLDSEVLTTLSIDQLRNGIVEILKTALVADRSLFEFLESSAAKLLAKDVETLDRSIFETCRIKQRIVETDEKRRTLLNFGHTIGHALENRSAFTLSHGEAVAIGMLVEGYIASSLGFLPLLTLARIRKVFETYHIPLLLPSRFSYEELSKAMLLDKKSRAGTPRFVLLSDIGLPCACDFDYCTSVDAAIIQNAVQWMNDALYSH